MVNWQSGRISDVEEQTKAREKQECSNMQISLKWLNNPEKFKNMWWYENHKSRCTVLVSDDNLKSVSRNAI